MLLVKNLLEEEKQRCYVHIYKCTYYAQKCAHTNVKQEKPSWESLKECGVRSPRGALRMRFIGRSMRLGGLDLVQMHTVGEAFLLTYCVDRTKQRFLKYMSTLIFFKQILH